MTKNINISLESFIRLYVFDAFRLAEKNLSVDDFYNSLFESVSLKVGVSKEVLLFLHHPFHWKFFGGENNSPLEYVPNTKPGEENYIMLKRNYIQGDIDKLSNKILKDYGNLLEEKIKKLNLF